jgi:hypothetical protein
MVDCELLIGRRGEGDRKAHLRMLFWASSGGPGKGEEGGRGLGF